mmetsp:Transcript_69194/g.202621  ORF Transcript_69194/g.202621 Transcript_69194/m.202621 type:complete len:356 (-) Transcript_69194:77-1144(-)
MADGRGRRRPWRWLAIAAAVRETQAFPLSFMGELPSFVTEAASLFGRVDPLPYFEREQQWPLDSLKSPAHPMAKTRRSGTLAGGRVHFATFALPGYEEGMRDLCREAEQSGLFAEEHCYEKMPEDALQGRWNGIQRKSGVQREWLHQPAIVQYLLRKVIPAGDILLFAEASAEMSYNATRWNSLLKLMEGGGGSSTMLAFQRSDSPEHDYTKADVFREFGVWMGDVEAKSYQISASYFLMQNVRPVHLFLTNYAEVMSNNPHLLNDAPSHAPNHKDFIEHRHEISLWSMMIKANRKGSNCRPLHRIADLRLRILPYHGCDDLREATAVPIQAHCSRHRRALKKRLQQDRQEDLPA